MIVRGYAQEGEGQGQENLRQEKYSDLKKKIAMSKRKVTLNDNVLIFLYSDKYTLDICH